jgi:hypothetical protein
MKIESKRKTIGDLSLSNEEKSALVKGLYKNAVKAVREIEELSNSADIDFATTDVDWNSACEFHSNIKGEQAYEIYRNHMDTVKGKEVENDYEAYLKVQQQAFSFYTFNFAWENATTFRIELFKDFMVDAEIPNFYSVQRNAEQYDAFKEYMISITNEEGNFVYFADTDEPIVVESMANGMSDELKAKADANNGIVSIADYTEDMVSA